MIKVFWGIKEERSCFILGICSNTPPRIVQEPQEAERKRKKRRKTATTWAVLLPTVFPDTKQASMDPNLIFQKKGIRELPIVTKLEWPAENLHLPYLKPYLPLSEACSSTSCSPMLETETSGPAVSHRSNRALQLLQRFWWTSTLAKSYTSLAKGKHPPDSLPR